MLSVVRPFLKEKVNDKVSIFSRKLTVAALGDFVFCFCADLFWVLTFYLG